MTKNAISDHLKQIHHRIQQACAQAQRSENDVSLVAVSKFQPIDSVKEALEAGQYLFGENRVQEAATKFPLLRESWPELRLHIIGSLQTNKALEACRLADMIESLDRHSLSDALEKSSQKLGRLPELLIQVNTGNEPQKSGISREEADFFIEASLKKFGPALKGLMAIPPAHEPARPHFRFLSKLAQKHGLKTLSMGMSADFEEAIAEGATMVRVGSAIFGKRDLHPKD